MGCFKFISTLISSIFTTIIILIILFPCGGLNFINNMIYGFFNPPEKILKVNSQKVADFSKIPSNYKLTKAVDMLGIKTVFAEDKHNKQTMAVVDTGWLLNITKDDIKSNQIFDKLNDLNKNLKFLRQNHIDIDNIKILQKGQFKAANQNVPYLKANVNLLNENNKRLEGIVGVVKKSNDKNELIVSYSTAGKYNQKLAENFFKHVSYNK